MLSWNIQQDAADQLTSITTDGLPGARRAFRYDPAGNRLTAQQGDAITQAAFNKLNQLTTLGTGGTIKIRGTTDEAANVSVQGEPAQMLNATEFVADAEVTAGTNAIPVIATDGSGNSRTNVYQVVVPPQTPRSFTYDANGNLLNDGIRTYEWDALNRPIRITQGNDIYEYAYNAFSQRVSEKKNGTLTKRWVWAGGAQPAEERDANNVVTKRFFAQGEMHGTTKLYYTRDHLGSIREVTDAAGATVAAYSFDAWGKRTVVSGTDLATFGFTGHYESKDLNLISTLYRLYDPEVGRWLSRDPIGENGGINLYGYVLNDPVNLWDPWGWEGVNYRDEFISPNNVRSVFQNALNAYGNGGQRALADAVYGQRYACHKHLGRLDMKHVAAAAWWSQKVPYAGTVLGVLNEVSQAANGYLPGYRSRWNEDERQDFKNSAFRLDDFVSNSFGDYYGTSGFPGLGYDESIFDASNFCN